MEVRELTKEEALKVLRYARERFIKDREEGFGFYASLGMCNYIFRALDECDFSNHSIKYYRLNKFIPNFNQSFLGGREKQYFWWPVEDTESRVKAFDKLIKYYQEL